MNHLLFRGVLFGHILLFVVGICHDDEAWNNFKSKIEATHYRAFLVTLINIDKRNGDEIANGGQAIHGVTQFADMTQNNNFESQILASNVGPEIAGTPFQTPDPAIIQSLNTTRRLVDWTGTYTSQVKDQGYCGSCWSFAATEQIESDAMRSLHRNWNLSTAQLVECDTLSGGCGGMPELTYPFIHVKNVGGLQKESDYPYRSFNGVTGNCTENPSLGVVTVNSFTKITTSEINVAAYVQRVGPVAIVVDASLWNN